MTISNIKVLARLTEPSKSKTKLADKTVLVQLDREAALEYLNIKGSLQAVVVEELPATGEAGVLYLVPKDESGAEDIYDEYLWVEKDGTYQFERVGATSVDLTDYYTKEEIDAMIGDIESELHVINNGEES